jgi:shikimate dehydrogenase
LAATELLGFAGVNVTHPYKQAIIPHLDALSDDAEQVSAVNTVEFRDGRRIGHNTDVTGFANAFRGELAGVAMNHVVQLGAGGGGAATAQALHDLGVGKQEIQDQDIHRAEARVESHAKQLDAARLVVGRDLSAVGSADGIVNATPMGMAAHPGMAVPAELLRPNLWAADIVYFPIETAFLAAARRAGCRIMDGSGMAVYQAVSAFEIFTGRPADAQRMRQALRAVEMPRS